MTPESANGSPNRVASRGTAFNSKNMTTKVGAAGISPRAEAGARAMIPPARRASASSRPSARPTAMAIVAISKFTAMRPSSNGRKADDSRSISGLMPPPSREHRLAPLEEQPEPAAQPDHDHHHRGIEDQQQRVGRGPAAGERRDVGERAQKLGRADEARDRRALSGIDQESHDLGRRAPQRPDQEIHASARQRLRRPPRQHP